MNPPRKTSLRKCEENYILLLSEVMLHYMFYHQVKYRMEGNKVRTTSLYDGEAREIAHVKHVSDLVSKVTRRSKYQCINRFQTDI